jgi:hypothetical protein
MENSNEARDRGKKTTPVAAPQKAVGRAEKGYSQRDGAALPRATTWP